MCVCDVRGFGFRLFSAGGGGRHHTVCHHASSGGGIGGWATLSATSILRGSCCFKGTKGWSASRWNHYYPPRLALESVPGIPACLARCACCARRARLSAHVCPPTTVASVFKVAAFFQACGRGAAAGQLSRRERCRPRYGVLTVSVSRGDEEGGEKDRVDGR